jgi:hypothetical protein
MARPERGIPKEVSAARQQLVLRNKARIGQPAENCAISLWALRQDEVVGFLLSYSYFRLAV